MLEYEPRDLTERHEIAFSFLRTGREGKASAARKPYIAESIDAQKKGRKVRAFGTAACNSARKRSLPVCRRTIGGQQPAQRHRRRPALRPKVYGEAALAEILDQVMADIESGLAGRVEPA